jgi:hypothetical protein
MAIQTVAADSHLRSSQTMGLSASTPLSITCWLNCNWNTGGRRSFVGIYGPATDVALGAPVTAVQIGSGVGTNDLTCWTWGGGTLVGTATGAMSAYNNVWAHIAYTYDGTTHSLYRNGILLITSTGAQIAGFLNQIYINGYPGSGTGESDAFQADQYAIYRRTLSAEEVLTMASCYGTRHGINNAIARFEFDGGVGTVSNELDLTGNGHHLTFTGAGTAPSYSYINTIASSNIRRVQ